MSKKIFIIVCGIIIFISTQKSYTQTNLNLVFFNGTDEKISIADIKTLRFINSGLSVLLNSGTNSVYELGQIKKITFKSVSAVETVESDAQFQVFPNPVKELLFLKSFGQTTGVIHIYSIDGKKVLEKNYIKDEYIDVSTLSRGVYIITLNSQAQKFTKL